MVSGLRSCWPLGGPAHPRFADAPGLLALLCDGVSYVADIKPATNTPFDGVDLPDLVEENLQPHEGHKSGDLCIVGGDHSNSGDLCIVGGDHSKSGDLCKIGGDHPQSGDLCNDGGDPGKEKQGSAPAKNGSFSPVSPGALLHAFDVSEDEGACDAHATYADPADESDDADSSDDDGADSPSGDDSDSAEHDDDTEPADESDAVPDPDDDESSGERAADEAVESGADAADLDDEDGAAPDSDSDEEHDAAHESETDGGEPADDTADAEDVEFDATSDFDAVESEDEAIEPTTDAVDDEQDESEADFDEDAAPEYDVDAVQYASNANADDVSAVGASLAKYLFSPLRGSKVVQSQEKYFTDAVKTMKPKARVKMKA